MMPAIIALPLSLNLITSVVEWDTLSDAEQQELQEIVNTDVSGVEPKWGKVSAGFCPGQEAPGA
jgi:sensor domain CHASE-containing protein